MVFDGFLYECLISMTTSLNTKSIKTASGAPRPKSAPRGSKSTTFAQGKFQVSNRQKMVANPIGEPSVSPFQYPIYLWLQAAA